MSLKKIRIAWRTVLSAILIAAAFPPWNQSWLIFVALVPWLMVLDQTATVKQRVFEAIGLSSVMTLLGYSWVAYAIHHFGELPWVVSIVGLLIFSLGNQPQFIVLALAIGFVRKRDWKGVTASVFLAAVYASVDGVMPKLFLDSFGHSLYNNRPLRQLAEYGGVFGLTFLIVLINLMAAQIARTFSKRSELSFWPALQRSRKYLAVAGGILAVALVTGEFRARSVERYESEAKEFVHLAAIQGNIGDIQKVAAYKGLYQAGESTLATYLKLSEDALRMSPKPDAIVWPETAYPSTFRTPMNTVELARDQRIERFVTANEIPLIFGGYDRGDGKDFNSVFVLNPKTDNDLAVYHKSVLLPFGEYIPGFGEHSVFKEWFPNMGFFGHGQGPIALEVRAKKALFRVQPLICYEALVSRHTLLRKEVGDARVILNVTNDSWFGTFGEPDLHLALSVFRSLEARLPQVRSTNTGITALILPSGKIVGASTVGEETIVPMTVPLVDAKTTVLFYVGKFIPLFLALVALFCFGWHRLGLRHPPKP